MKHFTHYLRPVFSLSLVLSLLIPFSVMAATSSQPTISAAPVRDVFITEVQTASAASSGEEFIEFYNATDKDIDLSDSTHGGKDAWKLQYFLGTKFMAVAAVSAPSTSWTSPSGTISLTGVIPAHDYYVLASATTNGVYAPGSIEADQTYSPHLSDDVALQLVDVLSSTGFVMHDRLIWSADTAKLQANPALYPAPAAGSSLQRLPNSDLTYVRPDGTLMSYAVKPVVSPRAAWVAPASNPVDTTATDPEPSPSIDTDPDTDDPTTPPPANTDNLLPPLITELLPNPSAPLTDAADEFIELYNPNEAPYSLTGLVLESGDATKHDFTFSDGVLPAGGYAVFYSSTTGIPLSNSGGKVILINGAGQTVAATDNYATAADGQAWAFDMLTGHWQWTTTPTPGAANTLTLPPVAVTTTTIKKTTANTVKKAAAKVKGASTVKKAKVAKAKKAKSAKTKKAKTASKPVAYSSAATAPVAPIHTSVLALVVLLAVAYGIYEYRRDLANKIHQLRAYRSARTRHRP